MEVLMPPRCASLWRLAAFCCLLFLTGCGTVINGTRQQVEITSNPPGARLWVDGQPCGVTPASIELRRKLSHNFTVRKDGYDEGFGASQPKLDKLIYVTGILLGLVGGIVDYYAGGAYYLVPDKFLVEMNPLKEGEPSPTGQPVGKTGRIDIQECTFREASTPS